MKELEFIEIIKNTLSKNSLIGDDCAYLEDLGIVITQDSLVEGIHFSLDFSTPYELGYKSIIVNLSDILASGATPKYVTISLSLPSKTDNNFLKEFYQACDDLSKEFNFEVIGGDLTGSDKMFISVCAIGVTKGRNISSRKNAKVGDYVIATGSHGSSAAGLWQLQNKINKYQNLIKTHLMPVINNDLSESIATKTKKPYAMMDTSDGLVDAIFKMAQASDVLISVDFDKITYDKDIKELAKLANTDFKNWVLYGGEDYQLIACINEESLKNLTDYTIIGQVKEKHSDHFVEIQNGNDIIKIKDLEKTFNHF